MVHPPLGFEQLPFDHPLYVLYSSGTTGVPKCIVHGAGGTLIQHLKELMLHTDLKREDRFFYYTTCGWMMWNWLASSLAVGSTLVLYDGSPNYPERDVLWDLADETGISVFGTSATLARSYRKGRSRAGTVAQAPAAARPSFRPVRRWLPRVTTMSIATSRPMYCSLRSPAVPTSFPASRSATR